MPNTVNVPFTLEEAQFTADTLTSVRTNAMASVTKSESVITKIQAAFQEQAQIDAAYKEAEDKKKELEETAPVE